MKAKAGQIIRIEVNGSEHMNRIVAIDGDKVILSKITGGRGRWWLPLSRVNSDGTVMGGEVETDAKLVPKSLRWQIRRKRYLREVGRDEVAR